MSDLAAERTSHHGPHAVVAGIDLNGLGVLRSLGRSRIPLIGLDTDLCKPECRTRYGIKVRVGALAGDEFVSDLIKIRSRFDDNPVLLLTQEASVSTVSKNQTLLSNAYRFTMPDSSIMADLLDKLRFQKLAEQHGFLVPRSVSVKDASGMSEAKKLRFPCVLKPATKNPAYGKRFQKAYQIATATEAEKLWSSIREYANEVIVQEWIEGGDSDVYFCLQYRGIDQEPISFVGRKTYQWPPLTGGTASCVPAPDVAEELTTLTNRFFDAVGFLGVGSMEYKRDARDGRFYMVEPTVGRTDFQEEIASLNGVNIPLAAYFGEMRLSAGRAVTQCLRPVEWRDPFGYAKAQNVGRAEPKLFSDIKVRDAYFRPDDPLPYVALKFESLGRRLKWTS